MTTLDTALERIERRMAATMPHPSEKGFAKPLTPEQMGRLKALAEAAEIIRTVQREAPVEAPALEV
jgi:hypothetical protein